MLGHFTGKSHFTGNKQATSQTDATSMEMALVNVTKVVMRERELFSV